MSAPVNGAMPVSLVRTDEVRLTAIGAALVPNEALDDGDRESTRGDTDDVVTDELLGVVAVVVVTLLMPEGKG